MSIPAPPNVLENDIVELTIKGKLCGQVVLTILHYRIDSLSNAALPDVMDELHDAFFTLGNLKSKYLAAAAQNYTMDESVFQVISPTRWARFAYNEGDLGVIAADAKTADLAAVIEKSTWFVTERKLKLDRGFTGSVHFAPVPDTKIANGLIDTTYKETDLADLGASIITNLEGEFGTIAVPVIYHKDSEGVKYTDVNRYHVLPEARVMRRRTVGRGI